VPLLPRVVQELPQRRVHPVLRRDPDVLWPVAHVPGKHRRPLLAARCRDLLVDVLDPAVRSAVPAGQPLERDIRQDGQQPVRADLIQAPAAGRAQPLLAGQPRWAERLTAAGGVSCFAE
jgi:hypothetical protein